jgi:hypothetical protein
MKMIAISIAIITANTLTAQTIKEDKLDEFTKNRVKRTSWEPLSKRGSIYTHVSAVKINNSFYLDLKVMLAGGPKGGSIFSVNDGKSIMFKLQNDTILSLTNPKYEIACLGCGAVGLIGSQAYGVRISIPLNQSQYDFLASNKITKFRLYTTDGYVESEIKDNFQNIVIKEFQLIGQ